MGFLWVEQNLYVSFTASLSFLTVLGGRLGGEAEEVP